MIHKELWDKLITYRNLKRSERGLHTLKQLKGSGRAKLQEEQEKIRDTLSKHNSEDDKKTIIPKSMNMYLSRLNNIFHDTFGEPVSSTNLSKIHEHDKILKEVYPKQDSYTIPDLTRILNDLTALIGVGSRYDDGKKMDEALTAYRSIFKDVKKLKEDKAGESKKTDHETKVWEDIDDLKAQVDKINPKDGSLAMIDKALLSLYLYLPPRRLEYSNLKVKRSKTAGKGVPPKDDNNYIEVSPQNITKRICLNKYKTSKTYGQFCFNSKDIPRELINALKPILDKRDDGEYLFKTKSGGFNEASNFSQMVKDAFMRRVGKPLKVNDIRHIYSSKLWAKNPTMNELKDSAVKMGHSVDTSLKEYRRVE